MSASSRDFELLFNRLQALFGEFLISWLFVFFEEGGSLLEVGFSFSFVSLSFVSIAPV